MIIEKAPRTERIDGVDHIVGTVAHAQAVEVRDARLDAAYVAAHPKMLEEACRFLRDWSSFRHRHDANLVAFFGQQLVFMRARVERVLREKLRIREFVPVETGYPRAAEVYGQQVDDEVGEAKVGRAIADDGGTADVESRVDFSPFVWVYSHYIWTAEELDAASYAGVPLLQRKAVAMANAIAMQLERIGRSGSSLNGLTGFLNNPNITVHTLTFGEHTSSATAAEMLADLLEIESTLVGVGGDHTPDEYALVVPNALDHKYRVTPVNTTGDLSVAEWFLSKSRRFKRIVPYTYLDDAVTPDIAASDAPMSMAVPVKPGTTMPDLEHVVWPFSVEYEELEPVVEGYRFKRRGQARCAGVDVRHPKLFLYVQNND